jgi:hypothetical protein
MTEWIGCDKCNSVVPAMYLIKMVSGELAFCGHHFNKFKPDLDKIAYEVIELNKKEEAPQLAEMAE